MNHCVFIILAHELFISTYIYIRMEWVRLSGSRESGKKATKKNDEESVFVSRTKNKGVWTQALEVRYGNQGAKGVQ